MSFVMWFFAILLAIAVVGGVTLEVLIRVPQDMIFQLPITREMKGKLFSARAVVTQWADGIWKFCIPAIAVAVVGYVFLVVFLCLG